MGISKIVEWMNSIWKLHCGDCIGKWVSGGCGHVFWWMEFWSWWMSTIIGFLSIKLPKIIYRFHLIAITKQLSIDGLTMIKSAALLDAYNCTVKMRWQHGWLPCWLTKDDSWKLLHLFVVSVVSSTISQGTSLPLSLWQANDIHPCLELHLMMTKVMKTMTIRQHPIIMTILWAESS